MTSCRSSTSPHAGLWPRAFVIALGCAFLTFQLGCASTAACRVVFSSYAPPNAEPRPAGAFLFVLSAAPTQTLADGSTRETGYFLNEFYEPYQALAGSDIAIAIATPGGRPPAIHPESLLEPFRRTPNHLGLWFRGVVYRDLRHGSQGPGARDRRPVG